MTTHGFYPLTLVEKKREYDNVHTLFFSSSVPISFVPGQYVHLLAPASPPGPENVRHLSIASIPEVGTLQFSLDLTPTSGYKQRLAVLNPGETVHIFKVKGEFVLESPPPPQIVFLAGGLGITPIRSLLEHIRQDQLPIDWRLAHVARGDFLYQNEIEGWGGLQLRIRHAGVESLVHQWIAERPLAQYYVCGSARFVDGVAALLKAGGIPETAIKIENFR